MKRLRELRKEKGISQQALAEILHVTQQSVYKYENGLAEPDLEVMQLIAEYFDTSVDYLIGYTDVPYRYENFSDEAITSAEKRALEYFRELTPAMKLLLEGVMKEAAENSSTAKQADTTAPSTKAKPTDATENSKNKKE